MNLADNKIIIALASLEILVCETDAQRQTVCDVLDLISRYKAEIERLRKRLSLAENCILEVDDALSRGSTNDYAEQAIEEYNKLVKEMVGDNSA